MPVPLRFPTLASTTLAAALLAGCATGPQASADDPDFEDLAAATPSYKAVRTRNDLYVEYANGEKEYYDLKADPLQHNNKPNAPRAGQLAGPLRELASCAQNCWAAAHVQGG